MHNENFVKWCIDNAPPTTEGCAFDIGANHGMFTGYMAQKFKKVYAFEPGPKNIPILRHNCQPFDNIEFVEKAVSDRDGTVRFYDNCYNPGGHSIVKAIADIQIWGHNINRFIEVPSITLDEFIKTVPEPVVFVKCDVEGAENFLWDKGIAFLTGSPNIQIAMEVHQTVDLPKLYKLFTDLGFQFMSEKQDIVDHLEYDWHYLITRTL